jgi:hypothetical protein
MVHGAGSCSGGGGYSKTTRFATGITFTCGSCTSMAIIPPRGPVIICAVNSGTKAATSAKIGLSVGLGTYGKNYMDTSASDMRPITFGISPRFCTGVDVKSSDYPISVYNEDDAIQNLS